MENVFMLDLKNADFINLNVFLRMDYNVRIDNGEILDIYKIQASFSTIIDVYNKKPAKMFIGSHLGRPGGKYVEEMSCLPIYNILKKIIKDELNEDLEFIRIEDYKKDNNKKLYMVENLRFYPEEQSDSDNGDLTLSTFFKDNVDILVVDAFGVLHRNDFSVCKTGKKAYPGNLIYKELQVGNEILAEGVDLIILGGSKIKDKIDILETLIPKCKTVIVVGALASSFLKYHFRLEVGRSKVEEDSADIIENIYKLSDKYNVKIYVSHDYKVKCNGDFYYTKEIPKDGEIVDIGSETLDEIREVLKTSRNVFWNGPPGIFEQEECETGSRELVEILAERDKVVVGGGETSACVRKYGKEKDFFHVSTGGGSFLKLLGRSDMPGVDVLNKMSL